MRKSAVVERNGRASVDVNENLLILLSLACAHDVNTRAFFIAHWTCALCVAQKKSSSLCYRSGECFRLRKKLLLRPRFVSCLYLNRFINVNEGNVVNIDCNQLIRNTMRKLSVVLLMLICNITIKSLWSYEHLPSELPLPPCERNRDAHNKHRFACVLVETASALRKKSIFKLPPSQRFQSSSRRLVSEKQNEFRS